MDEEELLDSKLSFLLDCFPTTDIEVLTQAVLHSAGNNLEAIDYILALEQQVFDGEEGEFSSWSEFPETIRELHKSFPSVEVDALFAFVDAHNELSCIEFLQNEFMLHLQSPNTNWTRTHRKRTHRRKADPSEYLSPPRTFITKNRTIDIISEILSHLESKTQHCKDYPELEDFHQLREHAQAMYVERGTWYRKAASAYRSGGLTGTGSASYYTSEANGFGQRAEQLNIRAAYHAFAHYNASQKNSQGINIDLHGLTVAEVTEIIELILDKLLSIDLKSSGLRLVTGAGHHSIGGPRLRPAIFNLLKDYNVPFVFDGHAVFTIKNVKY